MFIYRKTPKILIKILLILVANQNIPEAQFNFADIYYNNKDCNKSIHYLLLVSKQYSPL